MPIIVERRDTSGRSYNDIFVTIEGVQVHQIILDVSRFADPDVKDSEACLAPGFPVAANGGPVVNTTLVGARLSTDTYIDVSTARGMQAGDVIDAAGTNVTIAAGGIAYGGGTGGSDRVTLTGQIGAAKADGAAVKLSGADQTYVVIGPEAVKLPGYDYFVNAVFGAFLNAGAIEDNLGRPLTAGEKSISSSSGVRFLF